MASYTLNERAVARARALIESRQYVLDSDWGDVQPSAADENTYLVLALLGGVRRVASRPDRRSLGRDQGPARFVYGDFRRLHRSGLIACQYRAAEWRHKSVELAAHDLLQLLDETTG